LPQFNPPTSTQTTTLDATNETDPYSQFPSRTQQKGPYQNRKLKKTHFESDPHKHKRKSEIKEKHFVGSQIKHISKGGVEDAKLTH